MAAVILSCGIRGVSARAADSSTAAPVQTLTLPNGLRIVVVEDHAAPVVQVAMWYRFGSDDETPGKTGLAHGLEHMMFRGTSALSSAGLDDLGARLGGEFNANTSNDDTHFYFVVPADRMDLMVHVEADRMRNLRLTEKDWSVEKKAVLSEYDRDYSNPIYGFLFSANEKLFPNTPYGRPALGVRNDIVKSTAADLRTYYTNYYTPANATLVVTGDVQAANVFASAKRWFGVIPKRAVSAPHLVPAIPATGVTVKASAEFPFEILDLAYALPANVPATEASLTAAQFAIEALLNERGPMRKALVDSGLVLGYAPQELLDRQASAVHMLFYIAPGHTSAEVRKVFESTLSETVAKGIDPDFIEAARRSALRQQTYARDSISGLGDSVGSDYAFPGDRDPNAEDALARSITVDQVNAAAKAFLATPNVIGDLTPTTTDPAKAKPPTTLSGGVSDNFSGRQPDGPIVQAAWVKAGIKKPIAFSDNVAPRVSTLPNGIKLLIQEVHSNPTVIVYGSMRNSPTFDPPGKEGVGSIVSQLLGYGSAKYDFAAQHKLGDDLGAQLAFGRTFFAYGLSKDANTFVDALADDVQHPLFPENRFSLVRSQELASVSRRPLQPTYQSGRAFAEALYPAGDPALREDTVASINAITLDDVKSFAQAYDRPDLTSIVVIGDVDTAEIRAEITAAFGGWTATGPKPDPKLPPIPLPAPVSKLVTTQSKDEQVELGTTALARTNPDYDAFALMNSVLGNGSFDSRLMNEVRQKRGLVYGISSSISAGRDRGIFTVSFSSTPEKANTAVSIVKAQLRRLQTQPISAAELNRQKIKLAASSVVSQQSTFALAGALINIAENDLPANYYATLGARYAKITPSEIERVAQTYLHPNHLVDIRTGPTPASTGDHSGARPPSRR